MRKSTPANWHDILEESGRTIPQGNASLIGHSTTRYRAAAIWGSSLS
ncbi:MAG TPA: hypothetical protein VGM01_03360 [Ktedonobacteraceae bacterium]